MFDLVYDVGTFAGEMVTSEVFLIKTKLKQRPDIAIKPADKGSAVVVLSLLDYIKEAERQLNDSATYWCMRKDLTETQKSVLGDMFTRGIIDRRTGNHLTPQHPRTARFYLLPKLNKPGHPERPVVSSVKAPREAISDFCDFHLQPLAAQIPSCIQDITDFLRKLQSIDKLPPTVLPHFQHHAVTMQGFADRRYTPEVYWHASKTEGIMSVWANHIARSEPSV